MKEKIRKFILAQGLDDAGFAAVEDYKSPLSPKIETLFPEVKSIVVSCVKEMSHIDSPNPQIAMNGRLDVMEFARSANYKIARYLRERVRRSRHECFSFLSAGTQPDKTR